MVAIACLAAMSASNAPLQPVPFNSVTIEDRFWSPRQRINREVSVRHSFEMLEKAGNMVNLRLAAEGKREGYQGLLFTDSDLYKVVEGTAYTLATHPDPALDRRLDALIAEIGKAQMPDGYLNTWFQVTRPDQKWTNLRDHHELYCAGHLFEAAVAHHQATGKRNLLDIALKLAGHIDRRFGPNGTHPGYAGHPEIELALVKLWKATGDDRWFRLARKLTEPRGAAFFADEHKTPRERYDGTYWLDDVPLAEHREIKGHAVRAAYLLAGVADIVRETGDPALTKMLDRVWRNATEKRIFVTGGIGPSGHNEGFTVDYDLPNLTAYQETCASIAMALWGHRMGLLHGEGKYWDAVETALYNGLLSGVSLSGDRFFYVNPLASLGNHHRNEWFGCACCPPNVLRTIAWLGGYAYAVGGGDLVVNLYVGGRVETEVGGAKAKWKVETDYPWNGKVVLRPEFSGRHGLRLRLPGWCQSHRLSINGQVVGGASSGYGVVPARDWKPSDVVELSLEMPVVQVEAHPLVKENRGRAAVRRGPLVYCAEQVDNDSPVFDAVVPLGSRFEARFDPKVLGGVVVVEAESLRFPANDWERTLYQAAPRAQRGTLRMVPYGFWDNRAAGPMAVWMPTVPPPPKVVGPEGKARVSMSHVSGNCQPWGVNDGLEPESSGQQPAALCHFWPRKGGEEWVQYTWDKPLVVSGIEVYWFDDTGRGECRLPSDWTLEALVGGAWQPVVIADRPIALDKWCKATFAPLETSALRLKVRQKDGWASGIHEWRVIRDESD